MNVSLTIYEILTHLVRKYFPPLPRLTPPSGGTLRYQRIYTPLKSTFSGLQFRYWHYGAIFIRLAIVAFHNREITRNSDKIWPYSSSRSSKVIVLGVNWKLTFVFLLVIYTGWPKKSKPQSFVHIFVKYWPIVKIFSLAHSVENL